MHAMKMCELINAYLILVSLELSTIPNTKCNTLLTEVIDVFQQGWDVRHKWEKCQKIHYPGYNLRQ